jgi:hypothetical protein
MKADIDFGNKISKSGTPHVVRCVGGVAKDGSVIEWKTEDDVRAHIERINRLSNVNLKIVRFI